MKMKKVLSLVLAASMVLGSFSVAAANPATTTAAAPAGLERIVENGYFGVSGLRLQDEAKREEFTAIVLRLTGNADAAVQAAKEAANFSDVPAGDMMAPFIGKAVKEKLFMGDTGATTFRPKDSVSYTEMLVVLMRTLGYTTEDFKDLTWPAGYVTKAKQVGLEVVVGVNPLAPVKRETVAFAMEQALDTKVKGGAQTLAQKLGVEEVVAAELAFEAAQSGVKKVEVSFNRELTQEEVEGLKYSVKFGFVPYSITATYNDAKDAVVLESSFPFPAGDYTVEVEGLEAVEVKIEAEKVAKVEVEATSLQQAINQSLKVVAYNQFGEKVDNAIADANIYVAHKGHSLSVTGGKVDLSNKDTFKIDDVVVVTAQHAITGITATKTFKIVAAGAITQMNFGPIAPLKDNVRVYVNNEDLVIPYTLADQYGNAVKFAEGSSVEVKAGDTVVGYKLGDIQFTSTNSEIVNPSSFAVDKDGKLTFKAGTKAGTAVITAINVASGTNTSFQVKVEDLAKIKTFQMSHPGVLVAADEDVKIPFMATNSFGEPIVNKDFADVTVSGQVSFTSAKANLNIAKKYDSKTGELTLRFTGEGAKGSSIIYAWVDGQIASQITVDIKEAATPTKITGVKNLLTVFVKDADVTVTQKNLTMVDNYGRALTELPDGYNFKVTVKDDADEKVFAVAGAKLTAKGEGSKTIKVEIFNGETPVANSAFEFTATVIKDTDVKTYELKAVDTLYGAAAHTNLETAGNYAKAVTLVGKNAAGREVALVQASAMTNITSSDLNVVKVDGFKVYAVKEGTVTVAAWNGATKLAEIQVTATKDVPVATSIKFKEASYTVAGTLNLATEMTVTDQYGVKLESPTGTWASSDKAIATVANGTVTGVKAGEATISFVTTNGVVKTVVVEVAAE